MFENPGGLPALVGQAPPPPPLPPPRLAPSYRSLRGLSVALTWLLAGAALVSCAMAGAFASRRHLLDQVASGHRVSFSDGDVANSTAGAIAGWAVLIGLAVLVVLIVFLFRAAKNCDLWDDGPARWSPGWTIGAWFIPIGSVIVPVLVVREIWARTPQLDDGGIRRKVSSALVWCWWAAYLAGIFILRTTSDSVTLDGARTAELHRVVAAVSLASASIALLFVVRRLARRQERLGASATPAW